MRAIARAKTKNNQLNVARTCRLFKVNRSSYYRYFSKLSCVDKDFKDAQIISEIFYERKEKVGIRQIQMLIMKEYGVTMNLKKIYRIKRKYNLITKIRRKNKFSFFAKKTHEHKSVPNIVQRQFNVQEPDLVYTTDITQFNLMGGKKVYLAAIKDLGTKEIKSFRLSKNVNTYFTEQVLKEALDRVPVEKKKNLIVNSDQGFHFTHINFRQALKDAGSTQSMSRIGNCLDNAPIESFFGYLKDHVEANRYTSFEELNTQVTKEINYYNNERPQWNLKKMPPTEYRRHLLES